MIRSATYGEEEFLIGIPGSNREGDLVAQIETSSRAQVNRLSFDGGNRSLAARNFLAPRDCPRRP